MQRLFKQTFFLFGAKNAHIFVHGNYIDCSGE